MSMSSVSSTQLASAGLPGSTAVKDGHNFRALTCTCAQVTVTDDDVIEKSNLSRQFLFRDWNIGSAKSEVRVPVLQLLSS